MRSYGQLSHPVQNRLQLTSGMVVIFCITLWEGTKKAKPTPKQDITLSGNQLLFSSFQNSE